MPTKPLRTKWYIFGSYLYSGLSSDIDLLVVYDPKEVHPKDVSLLCKPLFTSIEETVSLRVHSTFLTYSEEREAAFIQQSKAVPLESMLNF